MRDRTEQVAQGQQQMQTNEDSGSSSTPRTVMVPLNELDAFKPREHGDDEGSDVSAIRDLGTSLTPRADISTTTADISTTTAATSNSNTVRTGGEETGVSAIRYVGEGDQQQREGHLMVLLPLSQPLEDSSQDTKYSGSSSNSSSSQQQRQKRELIEYRVYNELSAFLAFQHIQHRSGAILPDLPRRLAKCDFTWTYRHYDTQFSSLQAGKHLFNHARVATIENSYPIITDNPANTTQQQLTTEGEEDIERQPFAMMGAAFSVVSETLAALGDAYMLPQISSSSTAGSLDEMPLFARTIPTNAGDAHAMMAYLRHSLKVDTVGVLFVDNTWGRYFAKELLTFANQYNVTVSTVPYHEEDNNGSLDSVMNQLDKLQMRYFVGIIQGSSWKPVLRAAHRKGLIGNEKYQWFWGEALVDVVRNDFLLDSVQDWDLAQALHGTGVFNLKYNPQSAFDRAIQTAANSRQMQRDFIESHSEPELFDNFEWNTNPDRSFFQYTTFDAVIALGLTACDTPGLFTGDEFYKKLLQVDFEGVSGKVQFDNTTGTRVSMEYELVNFVLKSASLSPQGMLAFHSKLSATVDLAPVFSVGNISSAVRIPLINAIESFVYYDNTTIPPLALPPVEEDMNLIPDGALYFGLFLGALAMSLSIVCALWTAAYRKEYVVRAAQPIFLIQICVGTFLVAFAIVLLSFQEDMAGLDAACATIPWTLCIGFSVAISALYSKAERINQVMSSGEKIRRVRVNASDVIRPFLILMHIDVGILFAWTVSPFKLSWKRVPMDNYDEFGRSVESFGGCRPDDTFWFLLFVVPLIVTNFLVLVRCTVASYKGRHLPSEFSESGYLSGAMITLSEVVGIGGESIESSSFSREISGVLKQ